MDKLASNWQNFAQVGLQLEFAFRIQLLEILIADYKRDISLLLF